MIVLTPSEKENLMKILDANQDKYKHEFFQIEPLEIENGDFILNEEVLDDPNFSELVAKFIGKIQYEEKQVYEIEFKTAPPRQ